MAVTGVLAVGESRPGSFVREGWTSSDDFPRHNCVLRSISKVWPRAFPLTLYS